MASKDSFGTRASLAAAGMSLEYWSLPALARKGGWDVERLPFTVKILVENLLRHEDGRIVRAADVERMARWGAADAKGEIAFMPARVLLQDFTGVPAVVDLAAMRDAVKRLGADPERINPQIPVDLVIDHSVQVDRFGSPGAFDANVEREYERNGERYTFLRWGQRSFGNFRVVPPGTGICHQVNLEYLSQVVFGRDEGGRRSVFPDSLVGTDSHTTMVNGVGVFGWGVGGIEAEAVMLGQPYYMLAPEVVGMRLSGRLRPGTTATDLVLTVTQMLRKKGVVGKFVEFYGPGLGQLSVADRATIANMAPEYGATMGFFPVDDGTLRYLQLSGRPAELVATVEAYCKEQGLFRTDDGADPKFTDTLSLDLETVEPSLAGPKRPQDRVALGDMKRVFFDALAGAYGRKIEAPGQTVKEDLRWLSEGGAPTEVEVDPLPERNDLYAPHRVAVATNGDRFDLTHGAVVIAAITSCTNTSNPSVMLGAGLVAKKAVERGLSVKPWVKTSLAPGSKVVTEYLKAAGLLPYLEKLKFAVVGYGCTTCIGNSGPLDESLGKAVKDNELVVAAVLSGNRNFEGRINPLTLANYLASPPLVVAYALAGTVDIDMRCEPLGAGADGRPVYLRDVWPTQAEVEAAVRDSVSPEMFRGQYASVFEGDTRWRALPTPEGDIYSWDSASTYIKEPPFFLGMTKEAPGLRDIENARVLALLGDSVTTDHISPAGSIPVDSPAGRYLVGQGVEPSEFNSYGARRGNHEVMMRGTFANIRLKNQLVPGVEGGWTVHLPDGEKATIYDASMRYQQERVPLLVIAGKEYGTGSSRDWAAKGTTLLGVRAVIAESYERIHRSNLVGLGVLPLQFKEGENAASLGLSGRETYGIAGIGAGLQPRQHLTVRARGEDGKEKSFEVVARIDSSVEVDYYRHGGILHAVLRAMAK
jgi:aconitate hydratase